MARFSKVLGITLLTVVACATGEELESEDDFLFDGGPDSSFDGEAPGEGGSGSGGRGTGGGSGGAESGGSGGAETSGGADGAGGDGDGGAPDAGDAGSGGADAGDGGAPSFGGAPTCATGRKACSGTCVLPGPSVGCGLTGCTPCPSPPANGSRTCTASQCDIRCNTGYMRNGNICELPGGAGGTLGAGGAGAGGRGMGGSGTGGRGMGGSGMGGSGMGGSGMGGSGMGGSGMGGSGMGGSGMGGSGMGGSGAGGSPPQCDENNCPGCPTLQRPCCTNNRCGCEFILFGSCN